MNFSGEHLGIKLAVSETDRENHDYFSWCARQDFRLQRCLACDQLRYPPTTACPFCAHRACRWDPVEGLGTVYSYMRVHHPIQAAYKERVPYLVLLVELDTQRGSPTEHDGLRMLGNLVLPDGSLAPEEAHAAVGIGSRVRMVFANAGEQLSIPMWTVDERAGATAAPWKYPSTQGA